MLLLLVVTLTLCGTVYTDHTDEPPAISWEMGWEWAEVTEDDDLITHLRSDWRESGLQFKVGDAGARDLYFFSESNWYGALEFDEEEIGIYGYNAQSENNPVGGRGASKQSCNATGDVESGTPDNYIEYPSGELDEDFGGVWTFKVHDTKLCISFNDTKILEVDISRCASWILNPAISVLKMDDFETADSADTGKPADYYRYAEKLPSPEHCLRGEFWWKDECHTCPPGTSTVRQGDTEYNDCIGMRYISCIPEEAMGDIECVQEICPCEEYEECNRDRESTEYGTCTPQSQYGYSGGVSVTASAGLVAVLYALTL